MFSRVLAALAEKSTVRTIEIDITNMRDIPMTLDHYETRAGFHASWIIKNATISGRSGRRQCGKNKNDDSGHAVHSL